MVEVEVVIDHPRLYNLKLERIRETGSGFIYCEEGYGASEFEKMDVCFPDFTHSYEVLSRLNKYVLGWDCNPTASEMAQIAKGWFEKYGAELVSISHSSLSFSKCRQLSETEALNLLDEIKAIHAMIIDCEPEEVVEYLKGAGGFTIWWD